MKQFDNTLSKLIKQYVVAKQRAEDLKRREYALENQFIHDKGIKNKNGQTPKYIYCIDDPSIFYKLNNECARILNSHCLIFQRQKVDKQWKDAENNILLHVLSTIEDTEERKLLMR